MAAVYGIQTKHLPFSGGFFRTCNQSLDSVGSHHYRKECKVPVYVCSITYITNEEGGSLSWLMMPVWVLTIYTETVVKTNNSKKTFPLYLEESQSYCHKQSNNYHTLIALIQSFQS